MWSSAVCQYETVKRIQNSSNNPFPFPIGCLDYFKIPTSKEDVISYYNRKGTHFIIMQLPLWVDMMRKYGKVAKAITTGQVKLAENDSADSISMFLMTPYRDNGNLNRLIGTTNGIQDQNSQQFIVDSEDPVGIQMRNNLATFIASLI